MSVAGIIIAGIVLGTFVTIVIYAINMRAFLKKRLKEMEKQRE